MNTAPPESATLGEAWALLEAHARAGRIRELPVTDASGHVLARDARAQHAFPPFDRAVLDGFAVCAHDFDPDHAAIPIAGVVRSTAGARFALAPRTCMRINAGARLPAGADAVIPIDRAREADAAIQTDRAVSPGQYVAHHAALAQPGELLARAGTRVNGDLVAALVAGGLETVAVFARPRVAQLSTGDELVEIGTELQEGQIHDSNTVALEEHIRSAGGETVMIGRCPEDQAALRASLELGLANDLLCITGGLSHEADNHVRDMLVTLGVTWLIQRLQLRPGSQTRIGYTASGCWVVGLPASAVGCITCFHLFVRPLLAGLQGLPLREPNHLRGQLDAPLPANTDRLMYHPADWSIGPTGDVRIAPLEWRGSGDPFVIPIANALIRRAAHAHAAPVGEAVDFLPLELPQ